MNAFGKLLYDLRKSKGWTQTELADKLNVTNQAVSKWENGECYPETAILKPLAKLFDVTVDELLNGKIKEKTESVAEERVEEKDFEDRAFERFGGIVFFVALISFLLCGFIRGLWHPAWLAFAIGLLVVKLLSVIDMIKAKKVMIAKLIAHCVWLVAVIAYAVAGFVTGIWHPTWIVFLVATLADIVSEEIIKKQRKVK